MTNGEGSEEIPGCLSCDYQQGCMYTTSIWRGSHDMITMSSAGLLNPFLESTLTCSHLEYIMQFSACKIQEEHRWLGWERMSIISCNIDHYDLLSSLFPERSPLSGAESQMSFWTCRNLGWAASRQSISSMLSLVDRCAPASFIRSRAYILENNTHTRYIVTWFHLESPDATTGFLRPACLQSSLRINRHLVCIAM